MARAVKTKDNTRFPAWWELLNARLAESGEAEALYGDAHGCYEIGHSPETAATEIIVVRGYDAAED